MSISEACSCSLQARLHQVENARSREMKAHGTLVQSLEIELESRRISEGESRLALAKLRVVNCKLEAELDAAHGKARQLLEQLEAQRVETTKCKDRFKAFCEESDCQLRAAWEKSDNLLEEKRQLNDVVSEVKACLENAKAENQVLLAKYEEQTSKTNAQTADIVTLTSQITSKQQEIEVATERSQLLLRELTTYRAQQELAQERIKTLERGINRAVVTRNRALNWRRKRQELWENQFITHRIFLTWKACSVQAKLQSAAAVARCNDVTRARLQLIKMNVSTRCSNAKEELNRVRQACVDECVQMQSLRREICQMELPKLITILGNRQQIFDNQQRHLEMQLVNQREGFERERERLNMSRQDFEHCVQKTIEVHQEKRLFQKRQQHAIYTSRKKWELYRRVFGAWKEFYLRSIVGHATHTAMVFQSQHMQAPTSKVPRLIGRGESQQWTIPAPIRPISLASQHLELDRQSFIHSPISEAPTPIDTMWRKWRRVNVGVAGRGRKQNR